MYNAAGQQLNDAEATLVFVNTVTKKPCQAPQNLLNQLKKLLVKKYWAEFIGTFILVFAGTGAIVINELYGSVTHLGIGLTFGLVVMAVIYSIGEISGAHINPAVSIAFWIAKRMEGKEVLPYIFFQLLGALFASVIITFYSPNLNH